MCSSPFKKGEGGVQTMEMLLICGGFNGHSEKKYTMRAFMMHMALGTKFAVANNLVVGSSNFVKKGEHLITY